MKPIELKVNADEFASYSRINQLSFVTASRELTQADLGKFLVISANNVSLTLPLTLTVGGTIRIGCQGVPVNNKLICPSVAVKNLNIPGTSFLADEELDIADYSIFDCHYNETTNLWAISSVASSQAAIEAVITNAASFRSAIGAVGSVLELGLDQVNNTSDTDKPVSTLQAAAIAAKLDANNGIINVNSAITPISANSGKLFYINGAGAEIDFSTVALINGWRCWIACADGLHVLTTSLYDRYNKAITFVNSSFGVLEIEVVSSTASTPNFPDVKNTLLNPYQLVKEVSFPSLSYSQSAPSLFNCQNKFELWTFNYTGGSWPANQWFEQIMFVGPYAGYDNPSACDLELFFSLRFDLLTDALVFNFGAWDNAGNGGPGTTTENILSEGFGAQVYYDAGWKIRPFRKKTALATEYGTGVALTVLLGNLNGFWIKRRTNGNVELYVVNNPTIDQKRPYTPSSAITSAFSWSAGSVRNYGIFSGSSEAGGSGPGDFLTMTISRILYEHTLP